MTTINASTQSATTDEFAGRLGLRVKEFSRASGLSEPSVRRRIKDGNIQAVYIGGVPLITRAELQRLGLIS